MADADTPTADYDLNRRQQAMTEPEATEPTPTEETPLEEEITSRGASIVPMRASADALADLPNVPGADEWRVLAQYARVMAASGIVPRSLQGKPADCLVVLMTGRDLGIPITSAMRKVYVIDGQPSIAPQLKLALIRQKGYGRIVPHPDNSATEAWAIAYDQQGNQLGPPAHYTWDDAVEAGLVRADCRPGAHVDACRKGASNRETRQTNANGTANFCKSNWAKSPKRMAWWRAAGEAADDYFSEATMGLYMPDELGGMTDEDGNLIDVNSVDMPEGFDRPGRGNGSGGEAGPLVADEDAWRLQERVYALPDEAKAAYAERWKNMPALSGFTIRNHPAAKTALAESLLRGVESQWKARGEFGPEAALESLRADLAGVVSGLWLVLSPPAAASVEPEPFSTVASAPPETPAAVDTADTAPEPAEAPGDPNPATTEESADVPRGTKPEVEPDAVDAAIAEVKQMDLGDVKKELVDRDLSARGAEASVRLRLAMRLAEERGAPMQPTLGGADG